MKIVISDYPQFMMPDHTLEIDTLLAGLGADVCVDVYAYSDNHREEFLQRIADADALLSAFITIDAEVMDHAPQLKVIALNSTGSDQVDIHEATRRGIGVCPVGEYCSRDVAESAIAFMFALNKHFKFYTREIDENQVWDYAAAAAWPRLDEQVLGIVGFGKIGRCTAKKAQGLVKRVVACDPFVDASYFAAQGVQRCTKEELLSEADIVINHMNLTSESECYFDRAAFELMSARQPLFINLGRGRCVDEPALIDALDAGLLRAVGTDVIADETASLAANKLCGRDNVIITPHAAFYSRNALEDLERQSAQNIVHFLKGEKDKVFKLVNRV